MDGMGPFNIKCHEEEGYVDISHFSIFILCMPYSVINIGDQYSDQYRSK